MGFPPGYLNATIMLDYLAGAYGKFMPLQQWIALLLEAGDLDVRGINAFNATRYGVAVKQPGSPTTSIVFRKDGNELYVAGFGEGDRVDTLSPQKQQYVALSLMAQVSDILKRISATK